MKKANTEEAKQIMLISQKDIDRLARLEEKGKQLHREVQNKDTAIRKVVQEDTNKDSSSSSQSVNAS